MHARTKADLEDASLQLDSYKAHLVEVEATLLEERKAFQGLTSSYGALKTKLEAAETEIKRLADAKTMCGHEDMIRQLKEKQDEVEAQRDVANQTAAEQETRTQTLVQRFCDDLPLVSLVPLDPPIRDAVLGDPRI